MGKSISAVLILGLVGVCVVPATAPARSDRTAVVCFNKPGDAGNGFVVKALFRTTPRKCNIVHRRQPPTSSDTIQARHLHWSHWGRDRARGKGQALEQRLQSRLTLWGPLAGDAGASLHPPQLPVGYGTGHWGHNQRRTSPGRRPAAFQNRLTAAEAPTAPMTIG
jgi:hypothetical protein